MKLSKAYIAYFYKYILLISLLIFSTSTFSQSNNDLKTTRILFLIDGSSSMLDNWENNKNRFDAARALIGDIMDSITRYNSKVEFAVRIFGHQYSASEKNCYDTYLEVPFALQNNTQVKTRLQYIYPQGVSPIAWSLKKTAENDFIQHPKYAYSLILITDGGESCGGNICDVMDKIVNAKINFKPYIISLNNYEPLRQEYACVGKYIVVSKQQDFTPAIKTILEDNKGFVADNTTVYIPTKPPVMVDTPAVTNPKNVVKVDTPISTPKIQNPPKTPKVDSPINTPKVQPTVKKQISKIQTLTLGALPKRNVSYQFPIRLHMPGAPLLPYPKLSLPATIDTNTPAVVQPTQVDTPKPDKKPPVAKVDTVKPPAKVQVDPPPAKKKTDKLTFLKPYKDMTKWRMTALYTIPIAEKIKIMRLPKIDVPVEKQKLIVPKIDVSNQQTNIEIEDKNDPNEPGTFQIYYTDGKGKYYRAQPAITIIDEATKKPVFEGFRQVNTDGSPKQLTLPNGHYKIISKSSGREASFSVEKGKHKNVDIIVGFGSLSFVYEGTNEVPQGFKAQVHKRFEEGPRVEQPTNIVLTYENSNYHIEVNTLPTSIFNVDLEFDKNTVVSIKKAGTIQILNEQELGRIEFFYQVGGDYLRFYEMNIYGDVDYQKVDFRAGPYRVKYVWTLPNGQQEFRTKTFLIKPGMLTTLMLD